MEVITAEAATRGLLGIAGAGTRLRPSYRQGIKAQREKQLPGQRGSEIGDQDTGPCAPNPGLDSAVPHRQAVRGEASFGAGAALVL